MQKFEEIRIQTPVELICDCCCRVAQIDVDDCEAQEYVSLDFVGGYQSIFGDEARVTHNICQHFLKDKFGKYIKTESYDLR